MAGGRDHAELKKKKIVIVSDVAKFAKDGLVPAAADKAEKEKQYKKTSVAKSDIISSPEANTKLTFAARFSSSAFSHFFLASLKLNEPGV